ncbi:hypothetical protein NM208_g16733 [Fusarium decemcellulare]|uniref:Uncharacterized protein n=1 Tax=Fusarium decemcellulare TaxID=57161 RepID=A0ACC1RC11_9HYPO|nr:hypothetical protein NM208_g16733 [Fusarium decemcellulare]
MTESAGTSAGRPRTRQRAYKKPPPLDVPHIEEDAAERKRVLNVLAQRRYRERKRLNRLKANSAENEDNKDSESHGTLSPETETPTAIEDFVDISALPSSTQATIPSANITVPVTTQSPDIMVGLDLNLSSWDPLADVALASVLPGTGIVPDFLTDDNTGAWRLLLTRPRLVLHPRPPPRRIGTFPTVTTSRYWSSPSSRL